MKNNYKVYFLKSFLTFLWLLFAIWTYSIVNAAWNSYVNTWDTVTSTLWNDMIWRLVSHDTSITTLTTADSNNVKLTWNQTIWWTKTFSTTITSKFTWTWWSGSYLSSLSDNSRQWLFWIRNGAWSDRFSFQYFDWSIWQSDTLVLKGTNVWIWTSTPTNKLDVSGNTNTTSFSIWGWWTVTSISTDWTFSANSDSKLTTEKASKTYIDWKITNITNWTTSFTGFKFTD